MRKEYQEKRRDRSRVRFSRWIEIERHHAWMKEQRENDKKKLDRGEEL
jgi:hypothetical protein|tara:strand:+ start:83 stop:226 length:144 start_codon:yes stop_codon:yes gene_type:complete